MNVKKGAVLVPGFITPARKKWFFILILLITAVAAMAFGYYVNDGDRKPKRQNVKPAEWGMPTSVPDHIILNNAANAGTMYVSWRTDTTVNHAVAQIAIADAAPRFYKYAKEYNAETKLLDAREIESAGTVANYHSVTFTHLLPDTTYAYRVGDGTHWSEWHHFKTAAAASKPFTFLYFGDAQNSILENYSMLLRNAYKKAPDARLALYAGDLVHGAHNEMQWHEWFAAGSWLYASLSHMPAPGNHEYGGYTYNEHKSGNRKFSVQWNHQFALPQNGPDGLKEQAYYFDYQGARFIMLNSNEQLKQQAEWLEVVLKENNQKWTVVTFHHPVYSAANHDDYKELRTLWQPIFEKYGVDLVLTGHEHTYTRGQAVKGKAGGPVYVVSVSGGNMYYFKDAPWKNYAAQLQRKGENTQLFQVVNVSAGKIEFRAYTATGDLYDAFDLLKQEPKSAAQLLEHKDQLIPERTHKNTIAYKNK